jgi:hypothetical protein
MSCIPTSEDICVMFERAVYEDLTIGRIERGESPYTFSQVNYEYKTLLRKMDEYTLDFFYSFWTNNNVRLENQRDPTEFFSKKVQECFHSMPHYQRFRKNKNIYYFVIEIIRQNLHRRGYDDSFVTKFVEQKIRKIKKFIYGMHEDLCDDDVCDEDGFDIYDTLDKLQYIDIEDFPNRRKHHIYYDAIEYVIDNITDLEYYITYPPALHCME